ncbi:MAG: ribulose-phosphate 3-epimerase [Nitrososphaeria archaeon]|jgi:ribulose-phosphate 3-epimerase
MRALSGSVLEVDFWDVGDAVSEAVRAGLHRLHFDVTDGAFVPRISFGDRIVRSIARRAGVPSDVHLMVERPELQAAHFGGVENLGTIYFHVEAARDPGAAIRAIRALGARVGVAISPGSEISAVERLLGGVDAVLVMLVEPGAGGQRMIPGMLGRIRALDGARRRMGLDLEIAADGGIRAENAREVLEAGADVLVVGSGIFGQGDITGAVRRLLAELGSAGERRGALRI